MPEHALSSAAPTAAVIQFKANRFERSMFMLGSRSEEGVTLLWPAQSDNPVMPERPSRWGRRRVAWLAVIGLAAGCSTPGHRDAAYAPHAEGGRLDVPALTALGRALFFDTSLSASGRTSCASCHDPRHAYGPPNALSVQLAGRDGLTPGLRAAPSLRYLQTLPAFTEHHHDNDGDDSIDAGPTGGHTWDGRAGSAREQARLPLLSPFEMANRSAHEVAERVRRGALAARLREVFGAAALDDDEGTLRAVTLALEVFQQSPPDFYPYSSRYDQVLRGRADADAARVARARVVQRSSQGQLRLVPPECQSRPMARSRCSPTSG